MVPNKCGSWEDVAKTRCLFDILPDTGRDDKDGIVLNKISPRYCIAIGLFANLCECLIPFLQQYGTYQKYLGILKFRGMDKIV